MSETPKPPDALDDRGWEAILPDRAMTALRAEFEQSGKLDLFERLKVFVSDEKNALSYAAMAEQLGMTEDAVEEAVHRLKQRYGELLRAETVMMHAVIEEVRRDIVSDIRRVLATSGNDAGEIL